MNSLDASARWIGRICFILVLSFLSGGVMRLIDGSPSDLDERPPIQTEIVSADPEHSVVVPQISNDMPALAVVVDDCGFSMDLARRLASKGLRFTWAIIPNLRYSRETADMLTDDGVRFLVHMPMQAFGDASGKGGKSRAYAVGKGMSEQQVAAAMGPLIDSLEGAYGLNNHRGSLATEDRGLMESVMKVLRARDLFFLDSSTTKNTVAYTVAKSFGLDALRNNMFLDNIADREKVREQFLKAIERTKKQGSLVAICHLRPETVAFIETIDDAFFTSQGVRLVDLKELVELRKETAAR